MAIVLSIEPPYCFILLYVAYFCLEMWFGVFLIAFSSLFESSIQGQAIGYTLFTLRLVCGNLPSLIVVLNTFFSYHYSLLIMIPGFQFISAIFFLAAFFAVKIESN
ncbi:Oidioi.mRNA.OKI2018_I69.XSR.g14304.t1.cds [Oikopleura dioica]|uniref:Oidioi.mRNA.OKI2018_I69.XSR.g14304.t1.cds n=1 Tax=Oikopleura dioica TaxID=34765 RepID=A0ABN7SDB6_OIKDI|nr:Oidioi.mRNA.OKI2018_I69.XSR.g14304.t1.cds [Oikopleura dioica]